MHHQLFDNSLFKTNLHTDLLQPLSMREIHVLLLPRRGEPCIIICCWLLLSWCSLLLSSFGRRCWRFCLWRRRPIVSLSTACAWELNLVCGCKINVCKSHACVFQECS